LNRRGNSVLLVPLIAALALFYPAASRRATLESSQLSGSQTEPQSVPETRPATPEEEWSGGRKLVRYFLGLPKSGERPWGADDSRNNTQVEFLIATLPDPVDSALPHMFDRRLDSIQAALQQMGYLPTGRFRLPWQDCLLGSTKTAAGDSDEGKNKDDKQKACEQQRPFRKEPGVMLLRYTGDSPADKPGDEPGVHLLLLYLIGETPISGIQKVALRTALEEMASFCGWRGQQKDQTSRQGEEGERPFQAKASCEQIRILGPTFSGSAQSLDFALSAWLNSPSQPKNLHVKMVSGSATAIGKDTDFYNVGKFYGEHGPDFFSFSSMEAPDSVATCAFLNYLKKVEPDSQRLRVALLSEGSTVYGNRQRHVELTCNNDTEVTRIKFPLHISQLRAASQKVRESQQQTSPQIGPANEGLPLSKALEEVNQPHDTMPPLSPLDPLTSEQVIGQLLSTISRERYRYVGIVATDTRDTMFLAQEVREHCPSTVLFAFDPDLLFLHPEVNSNLRGMLVVTSYPLFNPNLLWSPPHPLQGESHLLTQFPDQGSEGSYNATLALLGDDDVGNQSAAGHRFDDRMLEYGLPFKGNATLPPLWITVVGGNQMWPLQVYDLKGTPAQSYMYTSAAVLPEAAGGTEDEKKKEEREKESWFAGVYPTGTTIFMSALTALCIVFCLPLLSRFRTPTGDRHATESWFGGAWLERFLGEAASERYRRSGELYLLAACTCLGIFLVVALAALLGPVIVMRKHEIDASPRWEMLAFLALCTLSAVVLLAASAALLIALRSSGRRGRARETGKAEDELNLPALGSAITLVAALVYFSAWLTGGWLYPLYSKGFHRAFFTTLRSLDLLSGVSPLVPLFLVFMAGFLWALSSFRRLRQLEGFESQAGFLARAEPFSEIGRLEHHVRRQLGRPSLRLPGAIVIVVLAGCAVIYLFGVRLVNSFEDRPFHWLLGVAFFAVHLALWSSVLRFCCVWRELHRLLHHLHCAPLRAYRRFQSSSPAAHKIDLASPPPTLAPLAYSIDQARTLCLRARGLLEARKVRLKPAVGDEARWTSAEIKSQGQEARWSIAELRNQRESGPPAARDLTPDQVVALQRLGSDEMTNLVYEAENHLKDAHAADVEGDWRLSLTHQVNAQEALSKVVDKVSLAANDAWWEELHGSPDKPAKLAKARPEEEVFQLGEDFLVGRVANFLAYVLPQMQNLIVTSVSGLLLMLFAISSYPFQPHNLLLLFNWAVILSFVGIAMWVFIQMNRDPVLSSLNGAKPGRINWDWDFVFRIFMYGIVPILALLGAQFPQSVGQIVSHLIPSEAMHQ
jgi:hypothetical protein